MLRRVPVAARRPQPLKNTLLTLCGVLIVFSSTTSFYYYVGAGDLPRRIVQTNYVVQAWGMGYIFHTNRQFYWFNRFQRGLKRGSSPILGLLETNPFPDQPPAFLRVRAYAYRFTTPAERTATGQWWKRTYAGIFPYVPPRRP